MGIGYCCNTEEKEIADGRIKYYGVPSITAHKYLQEEYFASRTESLNVSSLGGGLNPYFTYDLKVSSEYLVSCHGSAGVVINKYSNKSIQHYSNIGGSGGASGLFTNDTNHKFWKGGGGGTRYGFDGFAGSYGADFYTPTSIFVARGNNVIYYDIKTRTTKPVASFSGTIANKVMCYGGFLFVGTCGYDSVQSNSNYSSNHFPEYGNFMQNLISRANQYSGHGIYVYEISKILNGQQGFIKILKTTDNGHSVRNVTCMKAGTGRAAVGTTEGLFAIETRTETNTQGEVVKTPFIYAVGFNAVVTSVDALGEDLFHTAATFGEGKVFKNGNQLFNTKSHQDNVWCDDQFIQCLDFDNFQQYNGAFGAAVLNPLDTYNINSRSLIGLCHGQNSKNTPEQIGTFPTGIGVDENFVVVSLWQNGIYFFTHSGQLVASKKGWVSSPESCENFIRQENTSDPQSYNSEYSISAGPIAVGVGDLFVADSVQFTIGGKSGPLVYNPLEMYPSYTKNSNFVTLTQGFNIFGGIIHFHD